MALRYNGTNMGTFTLVQTEDGETHKFPIQIRQCNALAAFLYIYKQKEPEDPKHPYVHQLVCFFADEQHIRNCMRGYDKGYAFQGIFSGKLTRIRLNIYYKEMLTLAKHMTRDGLEVTCYYKEPRKK